MWHKIITSLRVLCYMLVAYCNEKCAQVRIVQCFFQNTRRYFKNQWPQVIAKNWAKNMVKKKKKKRRIPAFCIAHFLKIIIVLLMMMMMIMMMMIIMMMIMMTTMMTMVMMVTVTTRTTMTIQTKPLKSDLGYLPTEIVNLLQFQNFNF